MPCGQSGSKYDLTGNELNYTYGRLVQAIPAGTEPNQDKTTTPYLYDGYGNRIDGVKFQEAFERDDDGNVIPTEGPFFDWFWEEDANGNKQPRDLKFWLDTNLNMEVLPENKDELKPATLIENKIQDANYEFKRKFVSEDYTIKINDHLIAVDTSSREITLTLPPSSIGNQSFIIKDEGYNIENKNVTVVSQDSSDYFENSDSELIITKNGASITVYSNGNGNYFVI